MQEKLTTATLFEDGNQLDLQAANRAFISYDQLKAQEAVDQEVSLTQDTTPEILHVTPRELIDQASRNLSAIRQEQLRLTQDLFDLAA